MLKFWGRCNHDLYLTEAANIFLILYLYPGPTEYKAGVLTQQRHNDE
jgi:hypothetical protein